MLVLLPSMVVDKEGLELTMSPFKLQEIVIGSSPCETTHISWANVPESTTGDPKEKGTILGGSKMILSCKIILFLCW
jgi:hypothetical protein